MRSEILVDLVKPIPTRLLLFLFAGILGSLQRVSKLTTRQQPITMQGNVSSCRPSCHGEDLRMLSESKRMAMLAQLAGGERSRGAIANAFDIRPHIFQIPHAIVRIPI
jgi:predicted ABC-type transport system involved in lysophospholipase L1 biosynthesis ATPase subunit